MRASTLKSELVLATLLFCFGVALLPVAIYWVGQFVVGPYHDKAGLEALFGAIWADLGHGAYAAWILVLSPYISVQLFRLGRALWRGV